MSNFSFSHSVFKRLFLWTHKNQGLFWKGLINRSCNLVSDDIQEAYKRLRRLVMDYLGIGMASPNTSDVGDVIPDNQRENTDQNLQMQMGTRTWSRPSLSESVSQPFTRQRATQSPIISGRGIVVGILCLFLT